MNAQQKANALLIDKELQSIGLTNKFLRAGILAVVYKESGLIPIVESGYGGTPASRIRQIFGSWFNGWTDAAIDGLKTNPVNFFNHVYANNKALGNKGGNDGYAYRGRGFNQLTGRWNFETMGKKLGIDLLNNPDLLAQPETAAKACARFFYDGIVSAQKTGKFLMRHKIILTSQISNLQQGATVAHDCNGGWGIRPENDPTGGFKTTLKYAETMLTLIEV